MPAPRFSHTLVEALQLGYRNRGLRALVPWLLAASTGVPTFFADHVYAAIPTLATPAILAPVFAAFIVLGGFMASTSISLMGQTFTLVLEERFSKYAKDVKAFDIFIFWPQFALMAQLAFLLVCLTALSSYLLDSASLVTQRLVGLMLGMFVYALAKTFNLIDLVRQLAWYRRDYASSLEEELAEARKNAAVSKPGDQRP